MTGRDLRAAVERAVQLSHEKYCSASAMLEKTAELTFSVDIVDTGKPRPPEAAVALPAGMV